jgi:hypothetical protein
LLCVFAALYLYSSAQNLTGSAQSTVVEPSEGRPNPTAVLPISPPTVVVTAQPALPERRRMTVEFPPRIRAGDSDLVRLTLELDELGNLTPTAELEGNVVTGKVVEVPNLYESHHVIAEARLDLAGMEVRPAELVSEALTPGNSVTFYWSVRPPEVGAYRGTLWLYLRFVDKQSGEESRSTLSAQIVEIESANLFGLSGEFARLTGLIGSMVGTIVGFPFFEDVIKLFLRRRNAANR